MSRLYFSVQRSKPTEQWLEAFPHSSKYISPYRQTCRGYAQKSPHDKSDTNEDESHLKVSGSVQFAPALTLFQTKHESLLERRAWQPLDYVEL